MTIDIKEAVKEVRIVLDDIAKDGDEDFYADADKEIEQALKHAAEELLMEAPMHALVPTTLDGDALEPAQTRNTDGTGWIVLPEDYLRFVELKLRSWTSSVTQTIEPGSEEHKQQSSLWTRGTAQKPRAMETYHQGNHVLRYWTAGKYSNPAVGLTGIYDHEVETFSYVASPDLSEGEENGAGAGGADSGKRTLTVALKDVYRKNIIYRAASIFLMGRMEQAEAGGHLERSKLF